MPLFILFMYLLMLHVYKKTGTTLLDIHRERSFPFEERKKLEEQIEEMKRVLQQKNGQSSNDKAD